MPNYCYKCKNCKIQKDHTYSPSLRPDWVVCEYCLGVAEYQFIPSATILTSSLSVEEKKDRDYAHHINNLDPSQKKSLEKTQQLLLNTSKESDHSEFNKILDETRRELHAKKIDYERPFT